MYDWINWEFGNPRFSDVTKPIEGSKDLDVLSYGWCNSVPSADLVEIYADQYESTIRFINPNDIETHRTVNVEGVA